ncbi:MAG: UDP-glucose 4-epimerase GalE [Cytophagaceae bacterium]|nr:UDP-glucose 4-epimerase GalE [Cytophagaceae bacterium]MBK9932766.1 UDP-glucose 4-epimerase GalE [Cytophagaceae bacterium]MBL0303545.1 UDP-glucose 4-epimerase GalE [Cytophagaceae bacterium]MBL0326373.1 UDP-glucose 4-epimerase GalE [Cytophagaceae bacterium]
MKVLVTGGAGFIGSHTVVELVNAGYTPVIVDNFSNSEKSVLKGLKNILGFDVSFYEFDCNDFNKLKEVVEAEKIEGIIHFAAYKAVGESVANPLKYYRNNLGSMITVLEVMKETGVKNLVFSSSCTVYGQPDHIPVTEETPKKKAESPYGNTKAIGEDILEDVIKSGEKMDIVALRYFNPIGAHPTAEIGELPNGVPSNLVPFITQTAIGKREQLTVFGNDYDTPDGSNIRDFIHVVDLAKAHVSALELLKSKSGNSYDVFNLGTGEGNSVLELINTFEEVNDLKLNYKIGPRRPGDVEKIYGEVTKAEKILNWKTQISLDESLADAWRWEQKLKNN